MNLSQYRQIMEGKKELLDSLNKGKLSWGTTAAVAIVFEDGIHVSPNQACHAGLSNAYDGNRKSGAIGVVSALMKPGTEVLGEDEAITYLDWLLNRSPYASGFLSKSAHQALLEKVIISDTTKPSNLMAAGLVASRRLWEYPQIARMFAALAKGGMEENLAYWLSHMACYGFKMGSSFYFRAFHTGHCSMSANYSSRLTARNFINNSPKNLNRPFIESNKYTGYDEMFGGAAYPKDCMIDWLNENFPYAGEDVKDVNPFKKAEQVVDRKCTVEYAVKTLLKFEQAIKEEIYHA